MNVNRMRQAKTKKWLVIIFISIVIFLTAIRLQYTTSRYDETFNLWVSFYTLLGNRYLVDNPYVFQTGDLWNLPFIALLYGITGKTDGVVLVVRFAMFLLNLGLMGLCVFLFRRKFGKTYSVLFSLLFLTFAFGSIYSISYDTSGLFFGTAATLLLYATLERLKAGGRCWHAGLSSGICYACMAYSYPTLIVLAIMACVGALIYSLTAIKENRKIVFQHGVLPVACGGLLILAIFVGYLLHAGLTNTIFAGNGMLSMLTAGRPLGMSSSIETNSVALDYLVKICRNTWSAILFLWQSQRTLRWVTVALLIQYIIGLRTNNTVIKISLLFEIVLAAVICQTPTTYYDYFDNLYMYAYYFIWFPLLYFYLKAPKHRNTAKALFWIAWVPSCIGFVAVANTALYAMKAAEGMYLGALTVIVVMVMIAAEHRRKAKADFPAMLLAVLVACNLFTFYHTAYEGDTWKDCTYKVKTGILKGLYVGEADARYEKLEQIVASSVREADKTIYCSPEYIGAHFWAKLGKGEFVSTNNQQTEMADMLVLNQTDAEKLYGSQYEEQYNEIWNDEFCLVMQKNKSS